jgi:hypothetical protein
MKYETVWHVRGRTIPVGLQTLHALRFIGVQCAVGEVLSKGHGTATVFCMGLTGGRNELLTE